MTDPVLPPAASISPVNAEQSDQITELAAALAKAQAAITNADMSQTNPGFGNKPYADLSDVWEACRAPLTANGLSVVQLPRSDGQKITVRTKLLHSSGQWIQTDLTATAQQNTPQAVGSVITYLRRYSLAAMVGVAPKGDDDDGESGEGRGAPRNTAPAQRQAPPANRPPATQSAPAAQKPATPPPAETPMPEAVKPWAERFEKLTDKDEFKSLVGSTKEIFDSGTPEKKALSVVINKAAKRLGIEPTKKPADTATGTAP